MRTGTLTLIACVLLVGHALASPVLWTGNGNHYDLVAGALTWQDAQTAAAGRTFAGVTGHLATVTSAGENGFLDSFLGSAQTASFAWIGGYEPADDGVWRWADGPEAGVQFSYFRTPTIPYSYANWGGIEPNDDKPSEDFAMFNIGSTFWGIAPGQWADASPSPSGSDPVVGYLVEFETGRVPEPTGMLVGIMGLGSVAGFRRLRSKQHRPSDLR